MAVSAVSAQIVLPTTDTTAKKDTLLPDIATQEQLKKGFTNLFETSSVGGVTGTRLNPMAVSFVQSYMAKYGKGLRDMRKWATPHFNLIDNILTQHGLPKELKYLAVIESGLRYNAISWAGAVGPWAFMPDAARQYGLIVLSGYDERLDYYKSTHAAARFLTTLYLKYQDWLLVIAAYNCGAGNVDKAIRRSGSRDFWKLQYYLPTESMNHVKKFISTHYVFEGEGGITTVTKDETKDLLSKKITELSEEEMNSSVTNKISGRFSSAVILKYIDMKPLEFIKYNPGFDEAIALNGTYELRLPAQQMNLFISKRYEILEESMKALLSTAGQSGVR
ncbi:MAG: lytic transglycosylase domain-containing protein [Chitinophagales bacterium]|nr:lytic transglycosylase domain-containing protein [Chitinophagales bacterium]